MPRGKPGTFTRCNVEGCDEKAVGRGWCRKHYTRWHQHGDVETVIDQSRGICTIDGCKSPHKAYGWCDAHYRRWQRHGDPNIQGKRRAKGTPDERFWGYVDFNGPTPSRHPALGRCWLWTGFVDPRTGYGQHGVGRNPKPAHTWGYERYIAPIPEGMEPDHLCRNRTCVRFLGHLEPVTRSENLRRAFAARFAEGLRKTHCPHGHPYTDDNVYHTKGGGRSCKACRRLDRRAAADRRGVERDESGRAIRQRKTHCQQGHPLEDGNVYHAKGGVRLCIICNKARYRRYAEKRRQ